MGGDDSTRIRDTKDSPLRDALPYIALTLAIFLVFGRSLSYGFVNYDDPLIVINNLDLHDGLTPNGIAWAFTTDYTGNWLPLTWLSHMADFSLYGFNPQAHRFTNLLLHLLSAFCLYALLKTMTGAIGRSAFVAMLFAIHPLHVESVVWIAERKDVLSGLFWMLTLCAYVHWTRRHTVPTYALLCLTFTLGLMAKPMLVTLPCVLLLLDYWPLNRLESFSDFRRRIVEKLPLFAVALAASIITVLVQHAEGTTKTLDTIPLLIRIQNALIAYCTYLWKMVAPFNLAVLYPHRADAFPILQVLLAAALLIGVTLAALRLRKRAPYFLVGWLWYLGTLVPVIGILQVGDQAMADRYTYLPLIGIFIALAWGGADFIKRTAPQLASPPAVAPLAAIVILLMGALAWVQVGRWKDSITLFEHCLSITDENTLAHVNLGSAYHDAGRLDDATAQFEAALALVPNLAMAHNNLGLIWLDQGEYSRAVQAFRNSVVEGANDPRPLLNLGIALAMDEQTEEAESVMRETVKLNPELVAARFNLATLYLQQKRWTEAEENLRQVLEKQPGHAATRVALIKSLAGQGRNAEAHSLITDALSTEQEDSPIRAELEALRDTLSAP